MLEESGEVPRRRRVFVRDQISRPYEEAHNKPQDGTTAAKLGMIFQVYGKYGPAQESDEGRILGCFPKGHEFRIGHGHPLCLNSRFPIPRRGEGLYWPHLTTWRRQLTGGRLQALAPKKRGRKSTIKPLAEEKHQLQKQNVRLRRRLEQAELISVSVDRQRPAARSGSAESVC